MLSFNQYLIEVLSYDNNSLWAMHMHDSKRMFEVIHQTGYKTHPNVFPHLYFRGRGGLDDHTFLDSSEKKDAIAWGRADHDNKVVLVLTPDGYGPSPIELRTGSPRERVRYKQDINHKLDALDKLQKEFPDYGVLAGFEGVRPKIHTYDEHRKHLFGLLDA